MNKKMLLLSIIFSLVTSFFLATYFYMPYIAIPDDKYAINEIAFQEATSNSIDCSAIQKSSFLNELNVTDKSDEEKSAYLNTETPENQSSELHVFGVYSGTPIITIDKTKKSTILLLASGESTLWSIQLENDAQIKKIYTFGNVKEIRITKRAALDTLSKLKKIFLNISSLSDIEVIKISTSNACRTYGYKWKSDENSKFRYFINSVRKNTELIEHSFQGLYSFNSSNSPFEIPLRPHDTEDEAPEMKNKSSVDSADYPELITGADELMKFIEELISQKVIPESLPSSESGSEGKLMNFSPPFTGKISKIKVGDNGDLKCEGRESVLIVGDDRPNIIQCSWGNQVIYAGDGKDLIEDSWGNDIFYGGKGNDVIDAGWGSDIIIFNEGWGTDVVDKTCNYSKYNKDSTLGSTEHNYRWEYTSFIVFGPNIFSKDIFWKKDKLVNKKTGDTIEFKNKCFNFVYFAETSGQVTL